MRRQLFQEAHSKQFGGHLGNAKVPQSTPEALLVEWNAGRYYPMEPSLPGVCYLRQG